MRCKVYQRLGVWVVEIPTVRRVAERSEQSARATAALFDGLYEASEQPHTPNGQEREPRERKRKRSAPTSVKMPMAVPDNNPNNSGGGSNGLIAVAEKTFAIGT